MKLDSADLMKELEADVEKARLAHEEALAALAYMQKRFGLQKSAATSASTEPEQIPVTETGQIDLSELGVPETKPSLSETIGGVIQRLGDQEFTVGHILATLVKMGAVPDVKSPKASIAQALSVLEKKGDVERTFKGTGNTPHRFKVKTNPPEQAVVRPEDSHISFITGTNNGHE